MELLTPFLALSIFQAVFIVHPLFAASLPVESSNRNELSSLALRQAIPEGRDLFEKKCATCHQLNGEGIPPAFPPLAKADFLQRLTQGPERKRLISIVRNGLKGPILVNGIEYDGLMPAVGEDLTCLEIAELLTYVTNEWENQAEPFTEEEVMSGVGYLPMRDGRRRDLKFGKNTGKQYP